LAAILTLATAAAVYGASISGASLADSSANSVRGAAGAPGFGPDPGLALNDNLVDIAAKPFGNGYWITAADGGVFARGDAGFYGSAAGEPLVGPVVGITPTPTGRGYFLAAADGGVFAFGDARFRGGLGGYTVNTTPLNGPIVDIAATPTGNGYWLLASDGGVFAFGDARYFGSAASSVHAAGFIGIVATKSGSGYYMLETNGGVFTYGDARFRGSVIDNHLSTDITLTPNGLGYQIARTDGSVAGFGGAPSVPAPADAKANEHPVLGIAARSYGGVWLARGYAPPPPPAPVAAVSSLHDDPFLACTRAHESDSAGGYHAVSPGGVYRGAYQFLQSTWNNVAIHAGRPDLVGVDPAQASAADQDALAYALFLWQGYAPWGNRCMGLR
jgi:hypothetical protein